MIQNTVTGKPIKLGFGRKDSDGRVAVYSGVRYNPYSEYIGSIHQIVGGGWTVEPSVYSFHAGRAKILIAPVGATVYRSRQAAAEALCAKEGWGA